MPAAVSRLPNPAGSDSMPGVSPATRRIVVYWLLLLVPTLLVGAGAIQLLRREQARVAEQTAGAQEARRAAVGARARLVAENIELLVGDVQAGLLDALAAEPVETLDEFLSGWEKSQPLVRTAFRCTMDGRLLRPTNAAHDEDTRGFVRRFGRRLNESPPWRLSARAEAANAPSVGKAVEEPAARREVAQNVAQVQSARRDVQELLKSQNAVAADAGVSPTAAAAAPAMASGVNRRATNRESDLALSDSTAAAEKKVAVPPSKPDGFNRSQSDKRRQVASQAAARAKDAGPERRGWSPQVVDGRLHLLGWVIPSGAAEVRGVEVELAALLSRLAGALPAEVAPGEGYALRDDQRRILHQAGNVPVSGAAATSVPLAAMVFPGWEVAGFLTAPAYSTDGGAAFFGVGVLLVGIFIAAILVGGSLLLWQARRSQEEAAQKTSFVANVSHEFKTPLTTIRLYAELLEEGRIRDAAQGSEYLRTIGRETQRLARLVNNALDFSRLEQGRKKFARETVDLTAELTRLLDAQRPRLAECGLELHRELPAAPLSVSTDRDAFEQIVLNLLDNACKYAADGREVTVALASRPAGGVVVRIADRGPGVPAEHRERIFEKFHRVDDALTAEKTGAGLGLSIARQLARGLDGELRFAARAGGGAEFFLELPHA